MEYDSKLIEMIYEGTTKLLDIMIINESLSTDADLTKTDVRCLMSINNLMVETRAMLKSYERLFPENNEFKSYGKSLDDSISLFYDKIIDILPH